MIVCCVNTLYVLKIKRRFYTVFNQENQKMLTAENCDSFFDAEINLLCMRLEYTKTQL